MDAFIVRRGGGGNLLNFKVVGGKTAPENPVENTIWIDTEQEIAGWAFSADEPDTTADGMIWFVCSLPGKASFNALKEDSIFIYINGVKQYDQGAWNPAKGQIYQNGNWINLSEKVLYSYGVYNDVTFNKWAYVYGVGIVEDETDHVSMTRSTETDSQCGWDTHMDVSGYSTLYCKAKCTNAGAQNDYGDWRYRVGLFTKSNTGNEQTAVSMIAGTVFTANSTLTEYFVTIPQDISGACYVGVHGTGIAQIYELRLE